MNPIDNAESVANSEDTQNKELGTRGLANLPPQMMCQTQSMNKRKKLTADDQAALEAQKIVWSGTRYRSKPIWGK